MKRRNKNVEIVDSCLANCVRKRKRADRNYTLKVYAAKYIPLCFILVFSKNFLLGLLISAMYWVFSTMFFDHRLIANFTPTIRVWFGVPGSGKTSVAAWLSRRSRKFGYRVLSNVEISETYKLDEDDLGKYDFSFDGEGCHVIYDEANIEGLDNRQHTAFAKSLKPKFFALHRHMGVRVDVFSQAYDIDKRVRDRAGGSGLFYLAKFPIPGFVFYRQIKKVLFIKKDDKQMIDGFQFRGLPRICYTRSVWDSFNTLDLSLCPTERKEWKFWELSEE